MLVACPKLTHPPWTFYKKPRKPPSDSSIFLQCSPGEVKTSASPSPSRFGAVTNNQGVVEIFFCIALIQPPFCINAIQPFSDRASPSPPAFQAFWCGDLPTASPQKYTPPKAAGREYPTNRNYYKTATPDSLNGCRCPYFSTKKYPTEAGIKILKIQLAGSGKNTKIRPRQTHYSSCVSVACNCSLSARIRRFKSIRRGSSW